MTSIEIYKMCCHYFDKELATKNRSREIVYQRAMSFYLSKEFTTDSLNKIGEIYGMSHCSVIHNIHRFKNDFINFKEPFDVQKAYRELRKRVLNYIKLENQEPVTNNYYKKSRKILNDENRELKKRLEVFKNNCAVLEEKDAKYLFNFYKNLSNNDKKEFIKFRVKPYEQSVNSRIKNMEVTF